MGCLQSARTQKYVGHYLITENKVMFSLIFKWSPHKKIKVYLFKCDVLPDQQVKDIKWKKEIKKSYFSRLLLQYNNQSTKHRILRSIH